MSHGGVSTGTSPNYERIAAKGNRRIKGVINRVCLQAHRDNQPPLQRKEAAYRHTLPPVDSLLEQSRPNRLRNASGGQARLIGWIAPSRHAQGANNEEQEEKRLLGLPRLGLPQTTQVATTQIAQSAPSSNGKDSGLSILKCGFDPRRCHATPQQSNKERNNAQEGVKQSNLMGSSQLGASNKG